MLESTASVLVGRANGSLHDDARYRLAQCVVACDCAWLERNVRSSVPRWRVRRCRLAWKRVCRRVSRLRRHTSRRSGNHGLAPGATRCTTGIVCIRLRGSTCGARDVKGGRASNKSKCNGQDAHIHNKNYTGHSPCADIFWQAQSREWTARSKDAWAVQLSMAHMCTSNRAHIFPSSSSTAII